MRRKHGVERDGSDQVVRPAAAGDHVHERRHGGKGCRGGSHPGRAQRDVRTAVMIVLEAEAMHGYQIMQAISELTYGGWRPSPGAVYPTLAALEVEGLVTSQDEGGRKLVDLTAAGRTYLATRREQRGDPFAGYSEAPPTSDLQAPLEAVRVAARQVAASGSSEDVEAAARVLGQARRALYLILAGDDDQ